MKSGLGEDLVLKVGERLRRTGLNAYDVAEEILGRELADTEMDGLFDDLDTVCNLFKCEYCNYWHPTTERHSPDCCMNCGLEMDA